MSKYVKIGACWAAYIMISILNGWCCKHATNSLGCCSLLHRDYVDLPCDSWSRTLVKALFKRQIETFGSLNIAKKMKKHRSLKPNILGKNISFGSWTSSIQPFKEINCFSS